jgi:hypothetical protein
MMPDTGRGSFRVADNPDGMPTPASRDEGYAAECLGSETSEPEQHGYVPWALTALSPVW